MEAMEAILANITTEWTPAAFGVWAQNGLIIAAMVLAYLKASPALTKAATELLGFFERRQSDLELRMQALLNDQEANFAKRLAASDARVEASDKRHEECMEGQRLLRAEIDSLRKEYNELWGMYSSMRQGARSVENVVERTIREARSGS